MRPNKKKLIVHQIDNEIDFDLYYLPAREIAQRFTWREFKLLLMGEGNSLPLMYVLMPLIEEFVAMEDYMYCDAIQSYFIKHDAMHLFE